MLAYFPEPYRDELLYSLLARYHRHVGSSSPKQTLADLFDNRNTVASLDMQGQLGRLAANLPSSWDMTPERLAVEFTLVPYYLAFQPMTVRKQVLRALIGGPTSGLHLFLGLATAASRVRELRFCPACVREMEELHGEPYWRRAHQLPGALICPDHALVLRASGVPPVLGNRHAFIAATRAACAKGREVAPASMVNHETLLSVTRACRDVLQSAPQAWSGEEWAGYYRNRLFQAGLSSACGRVNQQRLEERFRMHIGDALKPLLADIGVADIAWLVALTRRRHRALHPLFHILLQEFLQSLETTKPFGAGPWPCLNPLSDHHGKHLIEDMTSHRNRGRVVGVFECACGYAYTRNVDPTSGYLSRPRPLRFGLEFDRQLQQMVDDHVGIRQAARRLHVDTRTVRLRAAKLALQTSWTAARLSAPSPCVPDERRQAWLALQKNRKKAGCKELSGMAPSLYAWLYRHDREWLAAHQPKARISSHSARSHWAGLDTEWVRRAVGVAEEIRRRVPPCKITLAEISRESADPGWLSSHLRHLPKTAECIRQLRDTTASFQARRVLWAADELVACGQPLVAWRIRRKAGLRRLVAAEVEAALAVAMSSGRRLP